MSCLMMIRTFNSFQKTHQLTTTLTRNLEEPSIKNLAEALHVTDQLRHFAQFNGYQDLALAVRKASDVISSLQLLAPKRQTALTDYFK